MVSFLVLSILALPFMADQTEATTVNIIQYDAQADDNRLDTAAIQKAIDSVSETGGTADIPAGTFDIAVHSSRNGMIMKSNVLLRMNADFLTVPTVIHCMETKSALTADISQNRI